MKFRITGLAAALAMSVSGAVSAQEPAAEPEMATTAAELVHKLNILGDALGIETPLFPPDALTPAFEAAIPTLSEDDERDWASTVSFDFRTEISTGAVDPDEQGRTVLTDARACSAVGESVEVVHFTRFSRGAVRGHRCIIMARVDQSWGLLSQTFAEGPDRRLTASYGVATSVEGEPDTARRLLEERLDQNVALAGTLADYALEMFVNGSGSPTNGEPIADRFEHLNERMADIAASFESTGPAPEPVSDPAP